MINLKKDKKILGCFFNGERIVDILNHKGDSMLDFSGTLNYFTNLPSIENGLENEKKISISDEYGKLGLNQYSYYYDNKFDLKSKYPLDLEYMIEQDNLGIFERTSSKFNIKLYKLLFQRYFLNLEVNNACRSEEITKEQLKTLLKISFDFDFEKVKTIINNLFFGYDFYQDKAIMFLKNVHVNIIENAKIKELMYDAFKNPDFYIEKYEIVKNSGFESIKLNMLNYSHINIIYHRNIEEDVFIISSYQKYSSYNNIEIHVANKTSREVTLEICYLEYSIEKKEEIVIPANSNDYTVNIQTSGYKDLYFIRRKDGKLLNNKYHTNGWVKLF